MIEYFVGHTEIILDNDTNNAFNELCKKHAVGMTNHKTYYDNSRNATNSLEDIFIGKKGECFTEYYLSFLPGVEIIKSTDLNIYHNKNWEADIIFSFDKQTYNISNKTTTRIMGGGGMSWVFQLKNTNNKFGRDKILDTNDVSDLVSLVFIDRDNSIYTNKAIIKSILPFINIKYLLKPPIIDKYKGIKTCIYYPDLYDNKETIL